MHTIFQHDATHFGNARKCKVDGCNMCLCELRSDAQCCCSKHKSKWNNNMVAIKNASDRKWSKINNKNKRIVADLYEREYKRITKEQLKLAGFDFMVGAKSGVIGDRKVGLFGEYYMWYDNEGYYYIEKLKK